MSVPYYGDFAEDDTVDIPVNTFDSNDPTASVTVTNFINTDVHIHKDGGTTQRNNAAGITVSTDFDGITGNHLVKIDTSDDTVAGFWVTGSEYQVRIEGATVDAGTINAWIGAFSIERAGGALALIKAGVGLADDAITASKYDESTAFPVKSADTGATQIARVGADSDTLETLSDQIDLQATLAICTEARLAELDAANLPTDIADIPTVAEFEARSLPSADYVVVGDTIARVTLVDTVTTNTDLVTAAAIKTAMEANNSDLDYLVTDLINKKSIKIATGISTQYNDAGASLGAIGSGYTDDGVDVERPRQVIAK